MSVKEKCQLVADTVRAWAGIREHVGKFRELLTQLQATGFKIGNCKTKEYRSAMIAIKHAYPCNVARTYLNYMSQFKKLLREPLPATGNIVITGFKRSRSKSGQPEMTELFPNNGDKASAAAAAGKSSIKPTAAGGKKQKAEVTHTHTQTHLSLIHI